MVLGPFAETKEPVLSLSKEPRRAGTKPRNGHFLVLLRRPLQPLAHRIRHISKQYTPMPARISVTLPTLKSSRSVWLGVEFMVNSVSLGKQIGQA